MRKSEAFYLASPSSSFPIHFDFILKNNPKEGNDGFKDVLIEFEYLISEFGKSMPFPNEILNALDEIGMDVLLFNTEFSRERSFFIKTNNTEFYVKKKDGSKHKIYGSNGEMIVFESMIEKRCEMLDIATAKTNYGRLSEKNP